MAIDSLRRMAMRKRWHALDGKKLKKLSSTMHRWLLCWTAPLFSRYCYFLSAVAIVLLEQQLISDLCHLQLLNDPGLRTIPQKFSVCEHGESQVKAEVAKAIQIMNKVSPTGVTPLTNHIWTIADHISGMAAELRRSGKIVAIILATDGLPTDDQGYGGEDITDEVSMPLCLFAI